MLLDTKLSLLDSNHSFTAMTLYALETLCADGGVGGCIFPRVYTKMLDALLRYVAIGITDGTRAKRS